MPDNAATASQIGQLQAQIKQLEERSGEVSKLQDQIKRLEADAAEVTKFLGVKAAELGIDDRLKAALAADVADSATTRLLNSGLFKGAKWVLGTTLAICTVMLGFSVAYFSFEIGSVQARADHAEARIDTIASRLEARLKDAAGGVGGQADSANKAIRNLVTSVRDSAVAAAQTVQAVAQQVSRSARESADSLASYTRTARDSMGTAIRVITTIRDTAIRARLGDPDTAVVHLELPSDQRFLSTPHLSALALGAFALIVAGAAFLRKGRG